MATVAKSDTPEQPDANETESPAAAPAEATPEIPDATPTDEPESDLIDRTAVLERLAASLKTQREAVEDMLEKRKLATTSLALALSPLSAADKNAQNSGFADSVNAMKTALSMRPGDRNVDVDEMFADIFYVVDRLALAKLEYNFEPGDGIVKKVAAFKDLIDVVFSVNPLVLAGAESEVARWAKVKGEFTSAAGVTQYRTANTAAAASGQRTYTPTRGDGELWTNRHFRVVMNCLECGNAYVSGSNKGSAQDQMCNHVARHGHDRPRTGDIVHTQLTNALNAVFDAPDADTAVTGEGGGFVVRRDYNTVPDTRNILTSAA